MGALALACGKSAVDGESPSRAERSDIEWRTVSARPDKADVDPALRELDGRRLVVAGTDADLAAVVVRLLRTERLADVAVGYLPAERSSVVASLWGLPTDQQRALDVAVGADPDPVPLVRDDSGGVLVGRGSFRPARGVAYCDEKRVLRGQASEIDVGPDPEGGRGLVVRIVRRHLLTKRVEVARGRAFQIGCVPAVPVLDGVAHPRTVTRWTWYRDAEDLRLVRGLR
ncbi:MAG: hypothetical protein JOZ47_17620 [Kutzneria sp.]|nr:hypothetical protein [Kutzneria sp.]MBV9846865.1 hypothetical protein [Kutzneria sp.]